MTHLTKDRRRQADLFVADLGTMTPKDDIHSMEHPLFALKAGDHRQRVYERPGVRVAISPGFHGLATIHDKDIWIFCISKMVQEKNRGGTPLRTVRFTAHEFLIATNRGTGGASYNGLRVALDRLAGTRITTDIKTDSMRAAKGFGLIDSWEIIEKDADKRMVALEVTLSDWLYRAVDNMEVLSLSDQYFRIRKAIDRRVYEICRKHCGKQATWKISLSLLLEKTGSTTSLRMFRKAIRSLADADELPDYRLILDADNDQLRVYMRGSRGEKRRVADLLKP